MMIFYWFLLRPLAGRCGASESHRFCPLQMRDHTAWLKKNQGVVINSNVWADLEEGEATDPIAYGNHATVVIQREVPGSMVCRQEIPDVW